MFSHFPKNKDQSPPPAPCGWSGPRSALLCYFISLHASPYTQSFSHSELVSVLSTLGSPSSLGLPTCRSLGWSTLPYITGHHSMSFTKLITIYSVRLQLPPQLLKKYSLTESLGEGPPSVFPKCPSCPKEALFTLLGEGLFTAGSETAESLMHCSNISTS